MKKLILNVVLLTVSFGVLSISYANSEMALDCMYQFSEDNFRSPVTGVPRKTNENLSNITLSLDTENATLIQGEQEFRYRRSGDVLTWGFALVNPAPKAEGTTEIKYTLNAVNGNLVYQVGVYYIDCSGYLNVEDREDPENINLSLPKERNCFAVHYYEYYQCRKVEKLF